MSEITQFELACYAADATPQELGLWLAESLALDLAEQKSFELRKLDEILEPMAWGTIGRMAVGFHADTPDCATVTRATVVAAVQRLAGHKVREWHGQLIERAERNFDYDLTRLAVKRLCDEMAFLREG